MPVTVDYHMHTHHSFDSQAPMEAMIESALQKGLTEICFTEHIDYDYPEIHGGPEAFSLDTDAYYREYLRMKERYEGRITLRFGLEAGMQTSCADRNHALCAAHPFDFIIGSIHLLDGMDLYYPDIYRDCPEEEVLRRVFEATLENIRLFPDFHVLGHLDYVTRYLPSGNSHYDYARYADVIDEIFLTLIRGGKGLDVNAKPLYSGKDEPNPHPAALRRFYELGGRIITFGSDAHRPEDIASHFADTARIALDAGFTEYCTFEAGNPRFHPLG